MSKSFLFATVSLLVGLHGGVATAQQTPASGATAAPAASVSTGSPSSTISEVVVTAQRRPERLQDVPITVTAVSGDVLKQQALNDTTQLALAVPSLQLGQENSFSIRGIGTLAFAETIDSSVATAIDDVNIGRPLAAGNAFLDVAQVEVLDGPQGLLFGKNASAGLINITTTKPQLGVFSEDFDVEADTRPNSSDGAIARVTLNMPVGDNSALRLNGLYEYQDALTTHVGGVGARFDDNLRNFTIRGKFLSNPTPNLSVYLIADYNEQHGISGYADGTYRSLAVGSTDAQPLAANNVVAGPNNFQTAGNAPGFRDVRNGGAQSTVSYATPIGLDLVNILAWRYYDYIQQNDGDITGADGLDLNTTKSRYNQYSEEFRVALPSAARLSGQAGFYYFHSVVQDQIARGGDDFIPAQALGGFPFCVGAAPAAGGPPNCSVDNAYFLGTDKAYSQASTSYALFSQLTYKLTPDLRLIGGARVTHDAISINLNQNLLNYFVPLGAGGTFNQRYSDTNLSYKLGAQYDVVRGVMLYATYSSGYKGPGFNDTPATSTSSLTVLPETSDSIEIGVKSTLLSHRLVVDISAFHNKLSNYQAQSFDTNLRTFVVGNAASVTNQGVEASLTAKPVAPLTLTASGTYLDSKFNSFAGAQCYPGQVAASCGVNDTFNAAGLSTPSSPTFTGTLGAEYTRPIVENVIGFLNINGYYRSSMNFLVNHAPGATVGTEEILSGSFGVRTGGWTVAVFCKNCTNKVEPTYIGLESGDATAGLASYTQQFGYNSVRTVGLRIGAHF